MELCVSCGKKINVIDHTTTNKRYVCRECKNKGVIFCDYLIMDVIKEIETKLKDRITDLERKIKAFNQPITKENARCMLTMNRETCFENQEELYELKKEWEKLQRYKLYN